MTTVISATGAAAGGSSSDGGSAIAKIQRQITATQKQINDTQGLLVSAPDADTRKLLQQQLQALAAQLVMLQQQMSVANAAEIQKSAAASIEKAASATKTGRANSGGLRTNANGVPIGGVIDVEA
jgi:predicted  nucleic acid-binding Zn-ribbon protein